MDGLIALLAELRNEVEKARLEMLHVMLHVQEEIAASKMGKRLEAARSRFDGLREQEADMAIKVRAAALDWFGLDGNKQPHPALAVKMYTVLSYDDGEALDYARKYIPGALRLDRLFFEKAAKVLDLDFVAISKEPRVTIARDLSEWLPLQFIDGPDVDSITANAEAQP